MKTRSRSTLFLIEQLIVIAVFAICAAACARILTAAYFDARDASDLSNAILVAENGAEIYKAVGGDLGLTAQLMGGITGSIDGAQAVIIHFDKNWIACGEQGASYRLLLVSETGPNAGLLMGRLSVETSSGEEIIAFPIAARYRGVSG